MDISGQRFFLSITYAISLATFGPLSTKIAEMAVRWSVFLLVFFLFYRKPKNEEDMTKKNITENIFEEGHIHGHMCEKNQ